MRAKLFIPLLTLGALLAFDVAAVDSSAVVRKRQQRMDALYTAMDDSLKRFLKPNLANGKKAFRETCFACHGADGRRVNFDPRGVRYLGTTAQDDIEVFWAMINFGDPVRGMESYQEEIPLRDLLDIAAYARTLPRGR